MTRLYNDPAAFSTDMVDGFAAAYQRYVQVVPGSGSVMRRGGPRPGKVSVIVGGGSGHYPAFCGVVGPGFADGAVVGDIFTSPSAEQAYLVAKALDGGAGVLFSYGNYNGDVINFGMASDRLRAEGVDTRTVLVTDDIASAPATQAQQRRGIAGDFTVFKMVSAAAEAGANLDEVERIGHKANAATFTLGAAFDGCTFPGKDTPLFTVEESKMEMGLGIHGEPGVRTVDRLSAAELATALTDAVLAERPPGADGRAAVILNGLGTTKYEELFVVWKDVAPRLRAAGVDIITPEVGELVTSLDMAGCSLTVTWLDDELAELWEAPADTPAFKRGAVTTAPRDAAETTAIAAAQPLPRQRTAATPESLRAAATVRAALEAMREVVSDNESRLGELDAVAGDGDHGRGMVKGLHAACAACDPDSGAGGTLIAAADAWADKAGGSAGVLWGALLRTTGQHLGDTAFPTPTAVAAALRAGCEEVRRLGGANVGDKTFLDALVPFLDSLDSGLTTRSLPAAWRAAAADAAAAAEATAELSPRVGRARPLAERSLGTADPGATSFALCVRAVAEVLHEQCDAGGDSQ